MRHPRLLLAFPVLTLFACTDHSSGTSAGAGVLNFVGFESRAEIPTGVDATHGVVLRDLDGDGRIDLAAVGATGEIQIQLNQGGGALAPGASVTGPTDAAGLRAADLDGDGDLDLVSVGGAGEVMAFRNDGFGDFAPFGASFQAGGGVIDFALGLVDGDQAVDLVVARLERSDLQFFGGNGDGTFRGVTSLAFQQTVRPSGVVIGDFDGDGRGDVAIADMNQNRVVLLVGDPSGMPTTEVAVPVGDLPFGLTAGDVTGDGVDDIVVACLLAPSIDIVAHAGAGAFQNTRSITVEGQPALPSIADVTGDGMNDVLCSVLDRRVLEVLPFTAGQIAADGLELALTGSPLPPAIADVDGDGIVDVLVPAYGGPVANLFRGGPGGPIGGRMTRAPDVPSPEIVAAADLDGDGTVEVLASSFASSTLSLLRGSAGADGSPRLDPLTSIEMTRLVRNVVTADIDRDGRLDLLVALDGGVRILANRSSAGTLAFEGFPSSDPNDLYAPAAGPFELTIADIDGDGALDLVIAYVEGNQLSVLRGDPGSPFVFGAPISIALGGRPVGMAHGDFDGDGQEEIAVSRIDAATVTIVGYAAGQLQIEADVPVGAAPNYLRTADFDRDGKEDIVVSNAATDTLTVLFGNNGGFRVMVLGAGTGPTALLTRDLNRDGFADVLVASLSGADFRVLLGDGAGGFQQALVFPGVYTASSAAFADLDGDGLPDLVIGSLFSKRIAAFKNISRVQ